jgi:pilus assembly protein CpaD
MSKITLASVTLLALGLAACGGSPAPTNTSLSPTRIPTVSVDQISHNLYFTNNRISGPEEAALLAFLRTVGPRFADRIAIEDPNPENADERIAALTKILGRMGVGVASVKRATDLAPGISRIVVSRASVTMDECPDWNDETLNTYRGAASSNYGCASRSNLARMVADPTDMLEGRPLNGQGGATVAEPVARWNKRNGATNSSTTGSASAGSSGGGSAGSSGPN